MAPTSIASAAGELIQARYEAVRDLDATTDSVCGYRALARAAVHRLHEQHVELRRLRRCVREMAAELRELRRTERRAA